MNIAYVQCSRSIIVTCVYIHIAGAMADNDEDYCISYTVTVVDVRSCTRPPRSPGHPPASTYVCSCATANYIPAYVPTYVYLRT